MQLSNVLLEEVRSITMLRHQFFSAEKRQDTHTANMHSVKRAHRAVLWDERQGAALGSV